MRKKRLFYAALCLFVLALFSGGCGGGSDHRADEPLVDPAFLSDLEFDETLLFEDEGEDILVSVIVDPAERAESVALYRTDEYGRALHLISHLLDDGSEGAGDVLPRDGVYTFLIPPSAQPNEAGSYYYRAFLDAAATRGSSLVELEIVEDIEIGAYEDAMSETEGILAGILPNYDGEISESRFYQYRDAILVALLGSPNVLRAELSREESAILIEFATGVDLCVTYDRTRVGTSGIREAVERELPISAIVANELLAARGGLLAREAAQPVGSYTARGLSPFYTQFVGWGGDDSTYAYYLVQNAAQPSFAAEPPVRDENVAVEHFKDIARFGVVILASHGAVLNEEPTIALSRQHTSAEIDALRKDIDSGGLTLRADGKLDIGPKFIARYNGTSGGDGYINLGLCQGIMREGLADALLKAGFAGVTGFTDNVDNDYAYGCSGAMIESMLSGQSFKEAFASTVAKLGEQDPQGNARFVMRMRGDVDDFYISSGDAGIPFVPGAGIRNGDFSQGDKYWEFAGGYTSIIPTLSGISPASGQLMAIVGTGLGGGFETEARMTQQFTVPQRPVTLSFHYDFISEHPHAAEDPQSALDEFRAFLVDSDGSETVLVREPADTLQWTPISSDIFDLSSTGQAYRAGWRRIECDIPEELMGRQLTLVFLVEEDEDCDFDSAILIDDVALKAK